MWVSFGLSKAPFHFILQKLQCFCLESTRLKPPRNMKFDQIWGLIGKRKVKGNSAFKKTKEFYHKKFWFFPLQFFRYCVVFKVDKAMKSCRRDVDTMQLKHGKIVNLIYVQNVKKNLTFRNLYYLPIYISGNTVCVLCDSKSQHSHLGGRCTGHGTEGKRTRFKNVLTPRCSGKWTRIMITDDGECPCKEGATFMFV